MSTELLLRELCVAMFDGVARAPRLRESMRVTGLGRHFALPPGEAGRLARAAPSGVAAYLEQAEEEGHPDWTAETDTAWRPLHRALARCAPPLAHAVLGPRLLPATPAYLVTLLPAPRVPAVSAALSALNPAGLPPGPVTPFARERLAELTAFYARAARAGRAVLFSVDL
ncbi:DUF1877 family protein [Streptomyces sp. CAU 1734]|uniref:DUF1877 family protein n=1 Tax=Streptomyces sp. CAU 1734 TaxID=3140360 RepID=UPI0032600039